MADGAGREFFTTRTVAEALAGFRPGRRTGTETVPLREALRRVPGVTAVSGSVPMTTVPATAK